MEIFNVQPEGEEEENTGLTEMLQRFIPRFEFEGEAAKPVGQAGMQPELGIKCACCGKAEHRKTLICDACENSFHLKCVKLHLSHVLLLDRWLCVDCTCPLDVHPSQPPCQQTVAVFDELCPRSSPSKRRRHSLVATPPDALPPLDGASKIRFVFKLKTSHFKGARTLADEEAQVDSDRSTDQGLKEDVKSIGKTSCHVKCLNVVQQQGHTNPSVLSYQEASEELTVAHWIHKRKAKRASISAEDKTMTKLPSCQMQSSSFEQQNRTVSNECESISEEFPGAVVVLEEKTSAADNSDSQNCVVNGLQLVTHHSLCLKFDDEYHKQDDNVCKNGTSSEKVKGVEVVEVQENKKKIDEKTAGGIEIAEEATPHNTDCLMTSFVGGDAHLKQSRCASDHQITSFVGPDVCLSDKTAGKIDMAEEATLYNTGCPMTSFVGVNSHAKQSGYAIDYPMTSCVGADASSSRSGYAGRNEKVDNEAEENRSLVRALDDTQKQLWHKDAIEFMDLEPSRGSKEDNADSGETLLSKSHFQMHVKLDTNRLLQAYADCRERCIILYHTCREKEYHIEAPQQSNVKVPDLAIERTWSLGEGFFVLLLGSKEAAKEVISNGTIAFQGGNGYAVPYVPCFFPDEGPDRACPVWVTFLHFPIYFRPFLQELAASLGKVLYIPYGETLEAPDSPRVCICWKISKAIPEFLLVDMEGLGSKKLKIEFDLSLLKHLSESISQKVASTVPVSV